MKSYYYPIPEGENAEIIIYKIAQQIFHNLDIDFNIDLGTYNVECQIIDRNLAQIIFSRTYEYTKNLTDIQKSIINSLTHKDFDLLCNNIAGSVDKDSFSITITKGSIKKISLNCTNLTKFYFDAFRFSDFIWHIQDIMTDGPPLYFSFENKKTAANTDFGDKELEKRIFSLHCSEIAKFANPEQLELLYAEIESGQHQPIIQLQEPRNVLSKPFYGPEGDKYTTSAKLYFNTVLDLFISSPYRYLDLINSLLLLLLKRNNPGFKQDTIDLTLSFFKPAEIIKLTPVFSVLNKNTAAIFEIEKKEIHKQYSPLYRI